MERFVFSLLLAATAALLPPQSSKTYRDDYVYSKLTDAFYKLHADGARYDRAGQICAVEGAALVIPRSIQDISEVHALFKQFPDIGDFVWVGDDGEVHESAEEEALIKMEPEAEMPEWAQRCLVVTREGEIESHNCHFEDLPFVCKVDAASAPYDANCDVYAHGYEYKPTVGSCYKSPNITYTWNQAYGECKQQGAHLVVLNSAQESVVVQQLMSATPYQTSSYSMYYYIAGIRAERTEEGVPRVFRTVFNQTLEEAGFAEWADTEPNNKFGNEYCGSLYESDGKYNDHNCADAYAFICEKEKTSA